MTPQDLYRDMHDQPDWYRDALCAQIGWEVFFPEKGENAKEAKQVCLRCPVREQCLREALANGEEFGIWGGRSVVERERLAHGSTPAVVQRGHLIPVELEAKIKDLLTSELSQRAIALSVGVSAKTVRRVRDRNREAA